MPKSQPELLFHEILHLKEPLVVSFAFYHVHTKSPCMIGDDEDGLGALFTSTSHIVAGQCWH